jgi:hypothetical protein
MRLSSVKALIVLAAFSIAGAGRAQDDQAADRGKPRFYVGVALGRSVDLNSALSLSSAGAPPEILDRFGDRSPPSSAKALKLVAGSRPARVVGVELQYVEFGEGEIPGPTGNSVISSHVAMESSADATMLSALLFAPLRSPSFDVYGKVGVANLDESLRGYAVIVGAPCLSSPCTFIADVHEADSHPYFAVGFRAEITRMVAFRAEYEAIDRDGEDTTMFSLGVAWEH